MAAEEFLEQWRMESRRAGRAAIGGIATTIAIWIFGAPWWAVTAVAVLTILLVELRIPFGGRPLST